MKKLFAFILGITAIGLAATAAFYSVYGLSQLFVGASLAVIILAGILEFSKIVVVSFLHQFWKKLNWLMKSYLIVAILVLMTITSAGIYGFLSSAYSATSVKMEKVEGKINIYDKKIETENEEKTVYKTEIENRRKRITILSELRTSQERRLDSLYQKGWYRSARKTEEIIKEADNDIKVLSTEISEINKKVLIKNDSIALYEITKLELNNNELVGEVGPLKYIASITGKSMDSVVNWLMLLFIFLIDPLAVVLIISTNKVLNLIQEDKDEDKDEDKEIPEIPEIPEKPQQIDEYVTDTEGQFKKIKKNIINIDKNTIVEGVFTAETKNNKTIVVEEINRDNGEYVVLLEKFYKNKEAKIDEEILSFSEFKKILENNSIKVNEKILQDFLLICGLLKITKFKDKKGVYNKSFNEALKLIEKI